MPKRVQPSPQRGDGFHCSPMTGIHIYLFAVKAIQSIISSCDLATLPTSQNCPQAPTPHLLSSEYHKSPRQDNIGGPKSTKVVKK